MDSDEDSNEELQAAKKKRKWFCRRELRLVKRWVTGDKAKMDSESMERESSELARYWMSQSKLKSLPRHQSRPTDHLSLPMFLCGNSIANTRCRRGQLFDCCDAHCTIDANVRPVFRLWRAPAGFNWTDAGNIMRRWPVKVSQA
jgi:hypothetical protein